MGCYVAIGIVCCVLVFPETMNHWYLDTVADLLGALKGYSALHRKVLDYNPDEVSQDADGVVTKSAAVREGLLLGIQAREFTHANFDDMQCLRLVKWE